GALEQHSKCIAVRPPFASAALGWRTWRGCPCLHYALAWPPLRHEVGRRHQFFGGRGGSRGRRHWLLWLQRGAAAWLALPRLLWGFGTWGGSRHRAGLLWPRPALAFAWRLVGRRSCRVPLRSGLAAPCSSAVILCGHGTPPV